MNSAIPSRAPQRFDVLRLPLIGSFLRWRYSRLILQLPLLLVAFLCVYDGFTGRQNATVNVAGVSIWLYYRGLVAVALAIFGNLFCAACPLMLTRGPSKFLSRFLPKFEWPRILRNKYLVLGLTVAYLFAYEFFDLWQWPYLTAWWILGYFAAALLVDTFFSAGTFCKYVCPLGNFNFALAGASPTQITATDPNVCNSCEGKYCLNGREETATSRAPILGNRADHVMLELRMVNVDAVSSSRTLGSFPGCETDLFVPTMTTNTDCTLCLNCVRACPYDNVALSLRSPVQEAEHSRPKSDWALFVTVLAWAGLVNAFAMVPGFYALAEWLSGVLGTRNEALLLAIIQLTGIGAGVGLTWLAARASRGSLRDWAPVLLPLTLLVWGGHYLYHFLTGYTMLWPNTIIALQRLGLPLATPQLPPVSRLDNIFPIQVVLTYLGLGMGVWAVWRRAASAKNLMAMLPQVLLMLVFVTITLLIFAQPMVQRGALL
jgi:polyferredoxin